MNGAGTTRKASGYNTGPGMNVRARKCAGICGKAHSIPYQFKGDSTVCNECVRRMPRKVAAS